MPLRRSFDRQFLEGGGTALGGGPEKRKIPEEASGAASTRPYAALY